MYRVGKHNAADVFNRWPNYVNEIKKDSCLLMFQSKLKVIKTVTPESLESLKGKPNETDYIKCVSDVFALVRHKLIIGEKFKMNWHKLPKSSMRKLNEADHTEHINDMTTLMGCKLVI